jgi:PAS domain S-box-containing protein
MEHEQHTKAPQSLKPGPAEDTVVCLGLNEDLPAPARFERANRRVQPMNLEEDFKDLDSIVTASALISMKSPHQILSVNKKFLQLLGYQDSELVGRSMKILHGPSTDPMALKGAIKSTAIQPIETVETTIHDKDGQEHDVLVICSPWTKEGCNDVLACLLQIKEVRTCAMKEISMIPSPDASTPRVTLSSLRKSSRHSYNFRIGLEMYQS